MWCNTACIGVWMKYSSYWLHSFGEKKFAFPQRSSLAMKIHALMQPKIALIFPPLLPRDTLQEILPWSRDALWFTWSFTTALRLHLGGGLQWTLLFRVRSDKGGAFRASNTDLVELDDLSLTLKGPLFTRQSFANRVSHAMHSPSSMLVAIQCPCAIRIT